MNTVAVAWRQFICEVCGLVYDEALGDPDGGLAPGTRFEDIPDDWACPICGVGKGEFEPYTPPGPAAAAAAAGMGRASVPGKQRDAGVLIIGAGRAGWAVAQALREHSATLPVTLLCACSGDLYDKPQLSVAVARGLGVDTLVRETAQQAARRLGVRLLNHAYAVHIDTATRSLRSTRGTLRWQQLVLAHGAEPALPAALAGAARHLWRVNDLASYTRLRQRLDAGGPGQRIAVIGAGLVGCELANDLALAGHGITLLDVQARPLAAQLPPEAGARLLAAWRALDIRFIGGVQVLDVAPMAGASGPLRLQLLDGRTLVADHVIAATGLRTAGRLARSAGLHFDSAAGGITTDAASGATSQGGIYALGDCAVEQGRASRFIEPIARQARGIAAAILGHSLPADAAAAALPVLRVKTSAMPITLTRLGPVEAGSRWAVARADDEQLQMHCTDGSGRLLASLAAGRALQRSSGPAEGDGTGLARC